jgi:hypothetical protein
LLEDYYSGLDTGVNLDSPNAPLPPHFQNFTVDGITYKLKYKERMVNDHPDKAVFVASVEPANQAGALDVVVKFAYSYCKTAHMLLAENSFAPRLQYCEKVESVGMYVVVMDLVVGEHISHTAHGDLSFADKLRTAVQILHDADFVHGDLREPNILVTEDGDTKIIDFDWCGKDREARYPSDINLGNGVYWDPDVTRGGLIKKDHDRTMFRRLTGLGWGANS